MDRRAVVGGSFLAGLSTLMSPADAEAAAAADELQDVSRSIDRLRRTVEDQFGDCLHRQMGTASPRIRQQQHTWNAFDAEVSPDFIEIRSSISGQHLRLARHPSAPVNMTRTADGRYTIVFMYHDAVAADPISTDFVGFAFDADGARSRTR
jgi:hypothetical protein